MILINLLPQDTRIVELTSGFALFIYGISMVFLGHGATLEMAAMQQQQFWYIILIAFGVMQVASIVLCSSMEHLRFVLAWFAGTFWVWSASNYLHSLLTPVGVGALVLGIMNLYAFIVNLLLVKQSWK